MSASRWRPFPRARFFARTLGLLGQNEWFAYARGDLAKVMGTRPDDIPFNPVVVYRGKGWNGMRDWLGPPPIDAVEPGYLDFKRARSYARALELKTARAWTKWCSAGLSGRPSRPGNIPSDPAGLYPRAWRGWQDWLGTRRRGQRRNSRYLPFEEARALVHALGIANVKEWRSFCKGQSDCGDRPDDVPANPDVVYCHAGWKGYGDWFGTHAKSAQRTIHLPYDELAQLVRERGLRSGEDYLAWATGSRPDLTPPPPGVPTNPHRTYLDAGWTTWGEFLDTGSIAVTLREFPPFDVLREIARGLGLRNHWDWEAYCRGDRPDLPRPEIDVPSSPATVYRHRGWTSWGDFLGTGFVAFGRRRRRSFVNARKFARSLSLHCVAEWRAYVRGDFPERPPLPQDIPATPEVVYADKGWHGWPNFLGHRGFRRNVWTFEEARRLAQSLELRGSSAWRAWLRGERSDLPAPPHDLPMAPNSTYRNSGWAGWGDFLGTGNVGAGCRVWLPFEEARAFARRLGFSTRGEWVEWGRAPHPCDSRRPRNVPSNPNKVYAGKGWRGWPDFLGFERRGR